MFVVVVVLAAPEITNRIYIGRPKLPKLAFMTPGRAALPLEGLFFSKWFGFVPLSIHEVSFYICTIEVINAH
jgi:hypothetical protein